MEAIDPELSGDTQDDSEPYPPIPRCFRKCVRKSDKICYSDIINATNTESENGETTASSTQDSLKSGESLFKTFTFEASEGSPDVEKCLAFWRSVVEKNLKPLRCNLIDNVSNQKTKKKSSLPPPKDGGGFEDISQKVTILWDQAWKEVQKRRLDKVKLRPQQRCVVCDLVEFETRDDAQRASEAAEIKELNQWAPYSSQPAEGKMFNTPKVFSTKRKSELEKTVTKQETEIKQESNQVKRTSTEVEHLKRESSKSKKERTFEESREPSTPIFATPESANFPNLNPCSCGCKIENCICAEFTDGQLLQKKSSSTTCSCSCGLTNCICRDYADSCVCGCEVPGCTCEKLIEIEGAKCCCSCGLNFCICQKIDLQPEEATKLIEIEDAKCCCDCGLNFCICQDFQPEEEPFEALKEMASVGVQSEDIEEAEVKEPTYCVICGHYDCYCRTEDCNL